MFRVLVIATILCPILIECHDCSEVKFGPNDCAKIYDDTDCDDEGDVDIIVDGTDPIKTLDKTDDDGESVVVKAGCAFRGYEHKLKYRNLVGIQTGRGKFITVTAPKEENRVIKDLDADLFGKDNKDILRDDFDGDISAASCVCGQNKYFDDGSRCPGVPKFLCAIAYENPKCRTAPGGSTSGGGLSSLFGSVVKAVTTTFDTDVPLEIEEAPSGQDLDGEYEDDIESISVRRGCTFTGYKETGLSGASLKLTAKPSEDLHVDLDTTDIQGAKSFKNKIESYKCTCN